MIPLTEYFPYLTPNLWKQPCRNGALPLLLLFLLSSYPLMVNLSGGTINLLLILLFTWSALLLAAADFLSLKMPTMDALKNAEPEFTEIWPVSVSSGLAYQLLFAWIHYVTIKQTQSIKLRKRGSTSPVCAMWRLHNSPAGFEPTGRLRTNYTGCWIWPSMKIPVRRELVTRLKTFLDYFGSHETSLNATRIRTQRSCPTGQ